MAETSKASQARDATPSSRGRWITIASMLLAAGVLAAIAYFGLKYVRDTSYQDERAFRVLGHIIGQFGNLQEAIADAVRLPLSKAACDDGSASDSATSCLVRRFALRGQVTLETGAPTSTSTPGAASAPACAEGTFAIDTAVPARRFCVVGKGSRLLGPLRDQIPVFITQTFFEKVAIAMADGTVLAIVPQGTDRSQHVQLHGDQRTDLFGDDASGLLRNAAQHEITGDQAPGKEEKSAPVERVVPDGATVYSQSIAGPQYRVFVLPFEPARRTVAGTDTVQRLYVIGLKRQDVLHSVSDALGSGGALVLTLAVLLSVLAWPFISLRFSSPQEAIAPTQLIAILLALLLIPAVLATTGFSLWTRWRLSAWADQQAEIYARRVEQALIEEMDCGVHILEQLARGFVADTTLVSKRFEVDDASSEYTAIDPHLTCRRFLANTPQDWSPIRLAAPLNAQGRSNNLVVRFFRGPSLSNQLDLRDREYFQAIMAGEEWRPGELWSGHDKPKNETPGHRYIAQRLFNRTDAARALQLSVPMELNGERIGLVTGDTRVYGLSAGLRPPLLRFAVFDQRNGALLFHTDDQLSLAENLLVETEGNATLLEAMNRRASAYSSRRITLEDHFNGRYTGQAHRFYYRPFPGAPWGIVVFYETDFINTIVLQTAVATLATYFSIVILAALVLAVLVIALPERVDIGLLKRLWPKWTSRSQYRHSALATFAVLGALAIILIGRLNGLHWLTIVLMLLLAGALVLGYLRAARPLKTWLLAPRAPNVTSYSRAYVAFLFGMLCLVSAVPTVLIAISYHDTSVHAFMRDELQLALRDEEQRRRTLFLDDRRFNNSTSVDLQRAAALSHALHVPGYVYVANAGPSTYWQRTDADSSLWLSQCGPRTLDRVRRLIWAMSTARQVQRPFASTASDAIDDDAKKGCPAIAVRTWRRSDDGTTVSAALPLGQPNSELTHIGACKPGVPRGQPCRDPELHLRYAAGSGVVLLLTTLGCGLLILLLSAHVSRRLFGIRIPFAGRFTPPTGDAASMSALLDLELELVALKNANGLQMTSKDVTDWRALKCEPIYRRMWELLTAQEQLLLRQLADGRYANPENPFVIEQLLSRGYVTLAPWPRIVEPGFVDFIRKVQLSQELHELRYEASHTLWSRWRTPILVIVVVTAGLLMWLAGSAMHILAGTLAGVAALFTSITQVTSFIHRDKPPPTS